MTLERARVKGVKVLVGVWRPLIWKYSVGRELVEFEAMTMDN